ncbi:recombining binding protein suppressor of hairless-like protein isoform X2 [Colossoma macropomum]|uniref:recombining binding protein suppressor of hairless-like protein isoform X1 n=1 Tax=Colossoma macropomum TaxID=42526 RepID=UPI0018650F9D|nr:recombining binding protein suppressor of hairless-like protein isoform X1 [Colossoma macropomum]XP_036427456.1 recombining binding protein suppressor of hairless-like protein isoform X2 [Colossoma macropomum]
MKRGKRADEDTGRAKPLTDMQDQRKAERETGLQCGDPARLHAPESALTHLSDLQQQPGWLRVEESFSSSRVTRDSVKQYLQFRPDQSVLILHAKVAQKSYGNEKRFFCPPPCVYLCGTGWNLRQEHLKASGLGESSCRLCGYMGLDSSPGPQADSFKLSFEEQTDKRMFACAKTLYISDTDKRKHFRLLLRLFHSGGQEIGSFQSGLIKVISKPSQKRQSMKNADLCISSGSRVSLFNRLRSQTVSTRYLAVEGGAFVASARQWTAFTVILAEDQQADHGDYSVCDSYICYGCVVQLVCTDSGVALPPMVIRKVNKQHACLDVDEPVSQLHKCAFQFRDSKHMYLCISNEKILQYQASPCPKESSRELLNDGSCWTIIGTEVVEYTFSESLACSPTTISPVPVINGLELNGGGHVAMLELHGENFGPHLKVWFGNMEAETMFRSPRSLLCVVPDISVFSGEWKWLRQPITVPLSLIRLDGLIYRSSFTFTYTPEHSASSQPCASTERTASSDLLIDTIHQEFTRTNFHLFMQS